MATRPIADFDVYIDKLTEFVYKTNLFMKPIFSVARKAPKRVVLPEGEEARGSACHSGTGNAGTGETDPYRSSERDRNAHSETGLADQKRALILRSSITNPIRALKSTGPNTSRSWKRRGVTQEQAQRALISNPTVIGARSWFSVGKPMQ